MTASEEDAGRTAEAGRDAAAGAAFDAELAPALADQRIAVLLPCLNEATTIAEVVAAFRASLPGAAIYVYDNDSDDDTAERARRAGAVVRVERQRGKGNVVRRMFADVEADIYVLADGDMTYDYDQAGAMVRQMLEQELDMLVSARDADESAHRPGHRAGNLLFNRLAGFLFGGEFTDIFSGYRVFSRRFVKSFPAVSRGFEIEAELTVHALDLRVRTAEVSHAYRARPAGSTSKLHAIPDGLRLLLTFLLLCKEVRPFSFFAVWALLLMAAAVILAVPLVITWLETGLVPRFPTAVLATGLALLGFLSLTCGTILDSLGRARHETKRLHYLSYGPRAPGPQTPAPQASAPQNPGHARRP